MERYQPSLFEKKQLKRHYDFDYESDGELLERTIELIDRLFDEYTLAVPQHRINVLVQDSIRGAVAQCATLGQPDAWVSHTIVVSEKCYEAYGWTAYEAAIRHELAHANAYEGGNSEEAGKEHSPIFQAHLEYLEGAKDHNDIKRIAAEAGDYEPTLVDQLIDMFK